ncbi:multicopper oxidase [Aquipluma nitroreducens]|uniref:Multicopper oxidase n=1 Tax=Aquipluma nitroreducens TaxID=2010828 RepID=A0A5K7SE93_9BACT|nr:multicopper oxidase domain-containing protein [Aquipluma nitroreducens]BBE19890.1 multicopper oxidase [Aquipluma nitroreducens]
MKHAFSTLVLVVIFFSGNCQNPLFIPPILEGKQVNLHVQYGSMQFQAGGPTATIGINGNFLGPTVILNQGDSIQLSVYNDLDESTTMHWHGLHVPARLDGSPHNVIQAHTVWSPRIKVLDQASTYWYHPHLHGKTAEQVTKGAAGMIIVRDNQESTLNLPRNYGIDDFPIVIQSRAFDTNRQFVVNSADDHTLLINGTIDPILKVPAQIIRFRVLNGSTNRVYNIGFQGNQLFYQIASDGGLLDAPVALTRLMLAPGERAELLVNLSGLKDQSLDLFSFGSELPNGIYGAAVPGSMGVGSIDGYSANILNGKDFKLIRLSVTAPTTQAISTIPSNLISNKKPDPSKSSVTRIITLSTSGMGMGNLSGPFLINGQSFSMDRIDFSAKLGATEIWQISNQTAIAHPFHIHGLQFFISDIGGAAPDRSRQGRKDVVLVPAMQSVRLIMKLDDFLDPEIPYMFHCHMLSHEDDGMMGQFLVTGIPTGLNTLIDDPLIRIYPNPMTDHLTIEAADVDRNPVIIEIRNDLGQLCIQEKISGFPATLNTSSLKSGIYTISFIDQNRVLVRKVIRF